MKRTLDTPFFNVLHFFLLNLMNYLSLSFAFKDINIIFICSSNNWNNPLTIFFLFKFPILYPPPSNSFFIPNPCGGL